MNDFLSHIKNAAQQFQSANYAETIFCHHNDTDGLSSAAILVKAFERDNVRLKRYCLEKPYPIVLDQLFGDPYLGENTAFVFADFASGALPRIAQANARGFDVYVLDHHSVTALEAPWLTLVNLYDL